MKKMWMGFLAVIMAVSMTACGEKVETDRGSIEEGRIVINGVVHTFGVDTVEQIVEKNTGKFDIVHSADESSVLLCDKDYVSSVLLLLDEQGTLYNTFMQEPDDGGERIPFSVEGIDETSSFFDVLEFLGLTENGVYVPYETYFEVDGYVDMNHELENGWCSVHWNGESGLINIYGEDNRYEYILQFNTHTMQEKNAILKLTVTYKTDSEADSQ